MSHPLYDPEKNHFIIIHSHILCGGKSNIYFTAKRGKLSHQNVNFPGILFKSIIFCIIPIYVSSESYKHILIKKQERDRDRETDRDKEMIYYEITNPILKSPQIRVVALTAYCQWGHSLGCIHLEARLDLKIHKGNLILPHIISLSLWYLIL